MHIYLKPYENEAEAALILIKSFWKEHNNYVQTTEEALDDLNAWTKNGHQLYFIMSENIHVGILHLGSRGGAIDWLEDIYVRSEYQHQGIGTQAIALAEQIVSQYSESLYIEAAARNIPAIRLYQRLGYNCLNTITIRKDFHPENFEVVHQESIYNLNFETKRYKA